MRTCTVGRVEDEVLVDRLDTACGVTYAEASGDADVLQIGGVDVPVASKRTLIRTTDTVRPSDHADRRFLEALPAAEDERRR